MFSPEKIKLELEKSLPGAHVRVRDLTGTNDHFEVEVVSEAFQGKTLVARHRIVYGALNSFVGAEIHALSMKTLTPTEAGEKK